MAVQDTDGEDTRKGVGRLALAREFFPVSFLAATIAYCLFLFSLSSISSFPEPLSSNIPDKMVHFFLYAGLSGVVSVGMLRAQQKYSSITLLAVPVGFSCVYGLSDEMHQLFVTGRTFENGDLVANFAGAMAAALLLLLMFRRRNSRPQL